MKPRPFGPAIACLAFLFVATLVVGGLGWVTAAALHVETDQRSAIVRADRGHQERLALWRLDAHVVPALGLETNRPFAHYTALHAPYPAVVAEDDVIAPGSVRLPSPLLSVDLPPWMILHFQIDPDNGWDSPQVIPADVADRLRTPPFNLTLGNVTPAREVLLADLRARFPAAEVIEALGEQVKSFPDDSPFVVPVPLVSDTASSKPGGTGAAEARANGPTDLFFRERPAIASTPGPGRASPDLGVPLAKAPSESRSAGDAGGFNQYFNGQGQQGGGQSQATAPLAGLPAPPYGATGRQNANLGKVGEQPLDDATREFQARKRATEQGLSARGGLDGGGNMLKAPLANSNNDKDNRPIDNNTANGDRQTAGKSSETAEKALANSAPGAGGSGAIGGGRQTGGGGFGGGVPQPGGPAADDNRNKQAKADNKEVLSKTDDAKKSQPPLNIPGAVLSTAPAGPGGPTKQEEQLRKTDAETFDAAKDALKAKGAVPLEAGKKLENPPAKEAEKLRDAIDNERGLRRGVDAFGLAVDAGNRKAAPTPQPVAVHVGPLRPVWLTADDGSDVLVLVRSARLDTKTVYQGVLLDWPAVRAVLAAQVGDLFPAATLAPVIGPNPTNPERMMTSLPVDLDPGPLPEPPPAGLTPLRLGLTLAWAAALVALLAVGFGGRALLGLSERRIRFVSAVTHELRTPLTSLRLYLDLLTSGMVDDDPVKQKEYLTTLTTESDRLNRLIENVLDFARLERRSVQATMVPTNVAGLLDDVKSTWADRCRTDGKELVVISTVPAERTVTTDARMAAQILGNLVDNARKYSRDAADARIWVWARPGERGRVLFEVEDRGPGVPTGERAGVFRAFQRGKEADTTAGGAGLGLALAKHWADLLGGKLGYRPADGGTGACFRLEL